MSGKSVFYPIGFDDNGLPTERLVEKVKKIRAKDFKYRHQTPHKAMSMDKNYEGVTFYDSN